MTTWLLVRWVPRVVSIRVIGGAMAIVTTFVLRAESADSAAMRMRVGVAVVAATVAFVVDDAAATTLASAPTTLFARRAVRVLPALTALGVFGVTLAFVADAVTGSGRPPAAAALETLAIALIGLVAAMWCARRGNDLTGGIAGFGMALACFASSYLPPRWWLPLNGDLSAAGVRRLLVVTLVAGLVAALLSADPAKRPTFAGLLRTL